MKDSTRSLNVLSELIESISISSMLIVLLRTADKNNASLLLNNRKIEASFIPARRAIFFVVDFLYPVSLVFLPE